MKEKLKIWYQQLSNLLMGKQNKEKAVESKDELLSLNKKKVIKTVVIDPNSSTPEESVFSTITQPGLEKSIVVSKQKNNTVIKDGIEESTFDAEMSVESAPLENTPPTTIVYELTFQNGETEMLIYTKTLPVFSDMYQLDIVDAFGRTPLREIVLGRKEIKTSCFTPLKQTQMSIDLRGGLLMKVIPEQDWMNRSYDETKKLFDEAVLKAYRDLAAQGITTPQTTAPKQKQQRQAPQQQEQERDDYRPGNIPVQRGQIGLKDF